MGKKPKKETTPKQVRPNQLIYQLKVSLILPFRARRRVGVAIFPSMPRVVPHSVILPRCLEGLNVFCFVFFSYLSPAAYGSGKSARNKVVAQFSRKNGTSIGSAQDR